MKRIISIGGGGAGMLSLITAYQLKKEEFEIITLSDEEDIYCRCTTPYIFTGAAYLEAAIEPDSLMTQYGLKIIREKAIKIDVNRQVVMTDRGTEYNYDYLVIATGSSPIIPDLPGLNLPQVFTVRTSADARNICTALEAGVSRAVVVGAGVIGLEMAAAFTSRGLKVTVIEKMPGLSPRLFDKEFATKVEEHLTKNGIDFRFGTELKAIEEKGTEKEVVVIKGGQEERLLADIIVLAIGVKANTDIVKGTPIQTTPHGIMVNRQMETRARNVYACGDCAVPYFAPTGEYIPSQLASSAIQQAKIVGFQIAGYPVRYNGSTGAFAFEVLNRQYAAVGLTEEMARKRFRLVVTGRAETTNVYKDLKMAEPLEVKLIFAGLRMRLVGYEAFGKGVIASAELASFAIGHKMNILSLLKFNYISHPSMTPWPFMNPVIMATEDAMGKIMKRIKSIFSRL